MCMLLHSSPCTYILWKVSDFVYDAFFPKFMKFDCHDIYQGYRVFYSSSNSFSTPNFPQKILYLRPAALAVN